MKTFLLTVVAVFGLLPFGRGYSLEGPIGNAGDAWQSPANGFGPPRDTVAPKNLGEEYRRNVPVVYYACNANFLDYFGSDGKIAIDKAFAILNKVFTNNPTGKTTGLDGYGQNLSEFPLNTVHLNYQAQALGLFDLKSFTLGIMMGQLGLADPVMYVWGIHDTFHVGNIPCPVGQEYLVVQRNFDYISSPLNQLQYSAYVNDTLYSYDIIETCVPPNPVRWAEPFSVDPLADIYTPVASYLSFTFAAIGWGGFYTGLTRDDVAGMRYMLKANNINWETVSADSLQFVITTNGSAPIVFPPYIAGGTNFVNGTNGGYYTFTGNANGGYGYGDLAAFLSFITTNPPAAVQAAYPGVVIATVTNFITIVSNVTFTSYFTNAPVGSPFGSPPRFVVVTNYQRVFQINYLYTFANIFTNHYFPYTKAVLQNVSVTAPIGSPFGSPAITNTTITLLNHPSGDFFVLPPFYTSYCPIDILPYGSIPTVLAITNFLTGGTTNTTTTSVSNSVFLITYFTNFSYVIAPVTCSTVAGATGLYEGIEKIQFVGTSFDSLLGQFFQPITNNYTMKYVTNGQVQVQFFQRVVTRPDYLFSASDQVAGPNALPIIGLETHGLGFDTANVLPGLAGPGTIPAPSTISFEKAGPVYFNSFGDVLNGTPYFTVEPGSDISDLFYSGYFVWASFDGTTNAPIVYPNGTSIDNLENQILVSVTPTTVPGGRLGSAYPNIHFSASSTFFTQPYTWSATGLPNGLNVSSNGTLSGIPTQSGNFLFNLTVTDSLSRSVQWYYSLTIQ